MASNLSKKDVFYVAYFVIHIPVTVFLDSCIVVPKEYQLKLSSQLNEFHIQTNKDFLLEELPLWLKIFGSFELLVQLPFFFAGSYYLCKQNKKIYPFVSLYGFNAFFTTLVCLIYMYYRGSEIGLATGDLVKLQLIYLPYLLIPFFMMVDFVKRIIDSLDLTKTLKTE